MKTWIRLKLVVESVSIGYWC